MKKALITGIADQGNLYLIELVLLKRLKLIRSSSELNLLLNSVRVQ